MGQPNSCFQLLKYKAESGEELMFVVMSTAAKYPVQACHHPNGFGEPEIA